MSTSSNNKPVFTTSRIGLCHQSSFCAENTMITIVPLFNYNSTLPLTSCGKTTKVGPFKAGTSCLVPLWIACVLQKRQFVQIQYPDWLSTSKLIQILYNEKHSTLLTTELPFYYYEIANALLLSSSSSSSSSTTTTTTSTSSTLAFGDTITDQKSIQILLQDLQAIRIDKIRQHFHELSRSDLQQQSNNNDDDDDELPMIAVTGIASIELNTLGPFLQRAFSDYGYLTRKAVLSDNEQNKNKRNNHTTRQNTTTNNNNNEKENDNNDQQQQQQQKSTERNSLDRKRTSMLRSRLRRFRS